MADKKIGEPAEVLAFIVAYRDEHGYPPSVRDIGERWDIAAATTHTTLRRLIDKGLIQMTPGIARSITITDEGKALLEAS